MAAAVAAIQHAQKQKQKQRNDGALISDEVSSAFEKYDEDGGGNIDEEELRKALNELALPVTKKQAAIIARKYGHLDEGRRVLDLDAFDHLYEILAKHRKAAPKQEELTKHSILGKNKPLPYQLEARKFYTTSYVTWTVAAVIIGNFLINIIETEIDPDANNKIQPKTWEDADIAFNIIFLFELLLNMYGYGGPVKTFWTGWNTFDFIIVTVGVLLMSGSLPDSLSKLKLLRAFRVFRLFKRIKSLNQIIVALIGAIPGVVNAFVIVTIFFCIYAILAVELFRDFGIDGTYTTQGNGNKTVSSETARGYVYGIEYYGTFTRAMYTLFQVMTGESWSEAVARPLVFGLSDSAFVPSVYWVSFIILTQLVLINVVVAVLLEKFSMTDEEEGETGQMSAEAQEGFLNEFLDGEDSATKVSTSPRPGGAPEGFGVTNAVSFQPGSLSSLDPGATDSQSPTKRSTARSTPTAVEKLASKVAAMETSLQQLHYKLDAVLDAKNKPSSMQA